MTSKISLASLLKESIRHNLAFGVLLMLIFFCYFPVAGAMEILSSDMLRLDEEMLPEVLSWAVRYGGKNEFLLTITFGSAILLGILQFSWLHSRKKTDFYHSIPVKREALFGIQYAAGVLLWLVPYAVNALIFLILCTVKGVRGLGTGMAEAFLVHIIVFLVIYSCMILAMMLTGKIFAAVAGMLVFCCYAPGICWLASGMMETHFSTFFYSGYSMEDYLGSGIVKKLSPLSLYLTVGRYMEFTETSFPKELMLAVVLAALLLTIICICLYRKRKSEAAGTAMAFQKAARVIKFLIVVPCSIMCYLIFFAMSSNHIFWGIFGLIFGLLVFSALVEFIYCMDIREIFRDKWQLLFTGIICLAIVAEFYFDFTGFDRWMPDEGQVESAEIDMNGIPVDGWRYTYDEDGFQYMTGKETIQIGEKYLPDVLELVKHSGQIAGFEETKDENGSVIYMRNLPYYGDELGNIYSLKLGVIWHMKDGSTKKRCYSMSVNMWKEYFRPLWEETEIQEMCYPFLRAEPEDIQKIVLKTDPNRFVPEDTETAEDDEGIVYTGDKKIFLEALREDFRESDVPSYEGGKSYLDIIITYRDSEKKLYLEEITVPSEEFPKTMALLEK